jgi:hypothetical protein
MRASLALCVIGLSMLPTGCALVGTAARNVTYKTQECLDDQRERRRDRTWAEAAWNGFHFAHPDTPYSDDFADGFKEGFADFLYAGGTGEPPALPPRRYRAAAYQTPRGYQAIEEWFAGYRQGAGVAHDGDFRRWITGPSSLGGPDAPPPPPPAPPPAEPAPQKLPESLPVPGKLPPAPEPDTTAPPAEKTKEPTGSVGWWFLRSAGAQPPPAAPLEEPTAQDEPDELPPRRVGSSGAAPRDVAPPEKTLSPPGKGGGWYVPPSLDFLPKP